MGKPPSLAMLVMAIAATPASAEPKVTVTIKPMHALVAAVMGDIGTPALLVSGSASPHTYAMKPSDAKALHGSDVFFRISAAIEPFTEKVVRSLPDTVRVVTLADSPGLVRLARRTGSTLDAQGHPDQEHHHDENAAIDGHIWLDPENAKVMVAEIARELSSAAPDHTETFETNARNAIAGIDALESEIVRDLKSVKGKPFVVFHDAYQYFERRFGLTALGSITVSPDVAPSARRLIEIRDKIAALGAVCVFAEPHLRPRLIDAVIEGTGARRGTLDPEGVLVTPGPDAYGALLRNLAAGLKACLMQGS